MELLQLRYFCDAAQTQNFSRTAHKFNVPPSNISQSIKRLEKELSQSLFSRTANSLTLNENGREFFEKINQAIRLIDEAKAELCDDENKGRLKLCIVTNRQLSMLTMEKFRKLYPEVVIMSCYDISDNDADFDIIITDDNFGGGNMKRELIVSEEVAIAMNRDNPLAQKKKITAADICNENFLCMNKGSSLYEVTMQVCGELGFEPNIVIESPDPGFIRKCVELGLGVTIVPVVSWEGLCSENVVIKSIGGFCRNTYAYWDSHKPMRKSTKNFLRLLKEECNALMNK